MKTKVQFCVIFVEMFLKLVCVYALIVEEEINVSVAFMIRWPVVEQTSQFCWIETIISTSADISIINGYF